MGRTVAVFDWDGVVIDSSVAHERSWEALAKEEGLPLPADHFKRGFGKRNELIIPDILGWTREPAEVKRLSNRKEALYRDIARTGHVRLLPGVRELCGEPAPSFVFEGSFSGLQAGLAGGFVTIALATTNTRAQLAPVGAHRIVADLSEVDPGWLARGRLS